MPVAQSRSSVRTVGSFEPRKKYEKAVGTPSGRGLGGREVSGRAATSKYTTDLSAGAATTAAK